MLSAAFKYVVQCKPKQRTLAAFRVTQFCVPFRENKDAESLYQSTLIPHLRFKGMVAHPRFDPNVTDGIGLGDSKQASYGARREVLIVATFRSWRGSHRAVA